MKTTVMNVLVLFFVLSLVFLGSCEDKDTGENDPDVLDDRFLVPDKLKETAWKNSEGFGIQFYSNNNSLRVIFYDLYSIPSFRSPGQGLVDRNGTVKKREIKGGLTTLYFSINRPGYSEPESYVTIQNDIPTLVVIKDITHVYMNFEKAKFDYYKD
jgi:hypothetical protein